MELLLLVAAMALILRLLRLLAVPVVQAAVEQLTLLLELQVALGAQALLDREIMAELLQPALRMVAVGVVALLLLAETGFQVIEAAQVAQGPLLP